MPKFPACSGAPTYGAPIQGSFTYPAIDETTGLSIELPTSEPTEAQISYTIATGHLPTLAGAALDFKLAPYLWYYGKNQHTGTIALSVRVLLNGNSITTTSDNCNTNYYFCRSIYRNMGATQPVVGDVIAVKLWSTSANTFLTAHAFGLGMTRLSLPAGYNAAIGLSWAPEATEFKPSFGTRVSVPQANYDHYPYLNNGFNLIVSATAGAGYLLRYLGQYPPYGIWRSVSGDSGTSMYHATSATSAGLLSQQRIKTFTLLPLNIKL